jgi:hypothetical protein
MADLNEQSLLDAISEIRAHTVARPDALLVTDEGIEYVKTRVVQDAEFRASVKSRAEEDEHYMAFLKLTGVWGVIEGVTK